VCPIFVSSASVPFFSRTSGRTPLKNKPSSNTLRNTFLYISSVLAEDLSVRRCVIHVIDVVVNTRRCPR
jgi:hypothetical protein